jgi:hypothetical protein
VSGIIAATVMTLVGTFVGGSFATISFFISGTLLLLSGMVLFALWMGRIGKSSRRRLSIPRLGVLNAARRRLKSLNVTVLLAVGVFIVTMVGANREGIPPDPADRSSGTGGFLFIGESAAPVKSLPGDVKGIGLSTVDGDDASCLNLTRANNPRLLGVDPAALKGRFSFSSGSDSWLSLLSKGEDGTIPAIADQTVLSWQLGLEVGDEIVYAAERGDEMRLRIVAALENSIFQGNLLVDHRLLKEYFPSTSPKRFFLLEPPDYDPLLFAQELARRMNPYGFTLVSTEERLKEFASVQNTYLAIFTLLGGLGILLGALGLGIAAARNIAENRGEYGLLVAEGYSTADVRKMIVVEHLVPLIAGAIIGFVSAMVAVLPSVVAHGGLQLGYVTGATAGILLTGVASISLFTSRISSRRLIDALRAE